MVYRRSYVCYIFEGMPYNCDNCYAMNDHQTGKLDISFNTDLPEPLVFSTWKHHLNYIHDAILSIEVGSETTSLINEVAAGVGGTLVDLYIGELTPMVIAEEVIQQLVSFDALDYDSFSRWLGVSKSGYQNMYLSDGSAWILRLGMVNRRYVHIHPSRYSLNTVRCRSANLKFAIAYRLLYGMDDSNFSIDKVNRTRETLGLPPAAEKIALSGALRILKQLSVKID